MTEPTAHTPPPAPGAAPKKKGLSPLAWIGIGCGGLLLLAIIAFVVAGAIGLSWLGGKAKEFEANPAMASAKMMVRVNPELELVESDDEAGTLTIRNKKTGEVMTVGLDEIEEGRIRFQSEDGEEITIGMEEGDEEGEGAFTVRDREGKTRMRIGAGGEQDIPSWVPRYEDASAQGTYYSESGGQISGGFSFETADSVDEVLAYFAEAFADAGLEETGRTSSQIGQGRYATINGEGGGRTVGVMATSEGETTQVVVSYSERSE
ncbi:MAG TPA: hypothetical protein VLF66_17045 [Thermoanaerobaculia bacterium]|nr:hypothetical protein [Thermoanaerobaculia bacterium]